MLLCRQFQQSLLGAVSRIWLLQRELASKLLPTIYRKRAIFVELLRMYLTPSSYKNPYKYSFEVGPKENWPLDFMNGGIQLKNASFKKMNFLPLRELLRRVSWATSHCDTDWQQQQHLTGWALK